MKKQERERNKNKKQGGRAVKSHVEIPALEGAALLSCRASHSSREYLAHGDTFLCQHPAKVAPRTDYPTRAALAPGPAVPGRGVPASSAGSTGSCSSSWGSSGGVPSFPGAGAWGKMGKLLLFAVCWRVFCDGTRRFWSLQILGCLRCRAPSAPGRERDALVTALPPLPPLSSGRMLKPKADASLAGKWPKLPQWWRRSPKGTTSPPISCSGRRLQGTVLPMGEGAGTRWGQEKGGVATTLHLLQNDSGGCCPHWAQGQTAA